MLWRRRSWLGGAVSGDLTVHEFWRRRRRLRNRRDNHGFGGLPGAVFLYRGGLPGGVFLYRDKLPRGVFLYRDENRGLRRIGFAFRLPRFSRTALNRRRYRYQLGASRRVSRVIIERPIVRFQR